LYLGLVCDGSPAYLQVQAYDFETAAWEVVLPLSNISYDRPAQASYPFGPNAIFREWTDVFSPVSYLSGGDVYQGNLYNIHQAILSDIEFDAEGNMILGIMDRIGHQLAAYNYSPDTTKTITYTTFCAGDILKAFKTSSGYVLEADPSNGEFFFDDAFHPESSNGGLAYDADADAIIVSAMDPITFYSGGLIKLNASTGERMDGLTLYNGRSSDGYAGKGAGENPSDW